MILSEKICMLRKQNGWSQEDLAEKLDISRQSVSKWENGTSIPDLDKIIKLSQLFDVSTDYLLKDEAEDSTAPKVELNFEEKPIRTLSLGEVTEYTELVTATARRIALGVVLCILGAAALIAVCGLSVPGAIGARALLTEDAAGAIGVCLLLLLVASGVILLITNGMKLSRYEFLEKEAFSLEYGIAGIIEKKKEDFEPSFRKYIALGVTLCITGVIPLLLAGGLNAGDRVCLFCTSLLLVLVACAVFLFVWSGMIYGSYQKILQTDDYTPEKKETSKRLSAFSGSYWCIVTALYLGISFYFNNWEISWIIWPVAGVLFAAVYQILGSIVKPKR